MLSTRMSKRSFMSQKKERTREFILQSSYKLFAKDGFSRITMKDICEETNLSRGGLYSHFSSTSEIFKAILEKLNQKEAMNFHKEIENGISAITILNDALNLMEDEMNHPEDSLSLALYEAASCWRNTSIDKTDIDPFIKIGEEKWTALIEYGISRGEFNNIDVAEIVNIILYTYQGVRMWSRITTLTSETIKTITTHIRKQLIKV